MRIAMVDDESIHLDALQRALRQALTARSLTADVETFSCGEDFLQAAGRAPYDLVFLDIYMQGMDGVSTARQLRAFAPDCPLVFTTTSLDHALDGYRLRAMQYLVKPCGEEEVGAVLDELQRRLPPPERTIELRDKRQSLILRLRDIEWADNYQHQVHVHLTGGKVVTVRMTFGEFAAQLSGDRRFFVCGRGVLVNLMHARDFDGKSFRMPDAQVPVSRDLTAKARAAFGQWLFHQEEN